MAPFFSLLGTLSAPYGPVLAALLCGPSHKHNSRAKPRVIHSGPLPKGGDILETSYGFLTPRGEKQMRLQVREQVRLSSVMVAAVLALGMGAAHAQKGETVKIAWIDPLSGLMASVGQNQLKSYQFVAEKLNAKNPAGV